MTRDELQQPLTITALSILSVLRALHGEMLSANQEHKCTDCIKLLHLHQPTLYRIKISMRTTVTLSEEAAELVDLYADAQGVSRSRAVSDLILRSVPRESRVKIVDGVPLLDIPGNVRKSSYEDVTRIESEGY